MKGDNNIFWVAFQSNVLADVSIASDDFKLKWDDAKKELEKQNFIFPCLQYNMRNTKQINNVKFKNASPFWNMQETIQYLECGNSSVVGQIPTMLKVTYDDWAKKRKEILKYSIQVIKKNNERNIVLIHIRDFKSKDIANDLETVLTSQTILTYPCGGEKEKEKQIIKDFSEKPNHILVTPYNYFNGCEAVNVIFVHNDSNLDGLRNQMLRGCENFVLVNVSGGTNVEGMKVITF